MISFKVGSTYYDRSIGDHNCIYKAEIVARTAKTVTIKMYGKNTCKKRITVYCDSETFKPFGSYSMAPIINADNKLKGN